MNYKLVHTSNGDKEDIALVLTQEMKEHLGVTNSVEVRWEEGRIILQKPITFEEAKAASHQRYSKAYEELAK
jgi:hypothetical protein